MIKQRLEKEEGAVTFEKATLRQLNRIMQMIDEAKVIMRESGINQWQDGYPNANTIETDITNGSSYVVRDGGEVVGYGVLLFGIDPIYNTFVGKFAGADKPYAAIHRVVTCQKSKRKGIATFIMENFQRMVLQRGINWLRIDTHRDNIPMKGLISKFGFTQVGTITIETGAQRNTYEKRLN